LANITIEVDSREQEPFLFPKTVIWSPRPGVGEVLYIKTVRKTLKFGDYRIAADPRNVGIERKMGLNELATNTCTNDRVRFGKAWHGFLRHYTWPVLVVEESLATAKVFNHTSNLPLEEMAMTQVWDLIADGVKNYGLIPLWVGPAHQQRTRYRLGERLVQLMMALRTKGSRDLHRIAEEMTNHGNRTGKNSAPGGTAPAAESHVGTTQDNVSGDLS
jgi:hypothetical protein